MYSNCKFDNKNILRLIFFCFFAIFSSLIFHNCFQYYSPCFDGPPDFYPESLGTIPLRKDHKHWLNTLSIKTFVHSSGKVSEFRTKGIENNFEQYDYKYRVIEHECGNVDGYDYFDIAYETIEYRTNDIPLIVSYTRQKLLIDNMDSLELVNATELLYVKVNNSKFEIPIDSSRGKERFNFYDSLNINNHTYYEVYHRFSDSSSTVENKLKVRDVYYNFDFGLLKFSLNNGELWSIKQ